MVEGAYTNSVFNAPLAPVYMIEANKRYLASFTSLLKFASTEGNAGIKLDGRAVNTDISLDDPLFGPGNIKFSTDSFSFSGRLEQYDCTDRMERNEFSRGISCLWMSSRKKPKHLNMN